MTMKIRNISPVQPRVDPWEVAEALGAQRVEIVPRPGPGFLGARRTALWYLERKKMETEVKIGDHVRVWMKHTYMSKAGRVREIGDGVMTLAVVDGSVCEIGFADVEKVVNFGSCAV